MMHARYLVVHVREHDSGKDFKVYSDGTTEGFSRPCAVSKHWFSDRSRRIAQAVLQERERNISHAASSSSHETSTPRVGLFSRDGGLQGIAFPSSNSLGDAAASPGDR